MQDPPATAAPRLRLQGISVQAAGAVLLSGIELELSWGELVAVRGPSGCGKTTLLRAAAGLIDPHDGTVTLDGAKPSELGWPVFRRRSILIGQRPVLLAGGVCHNLARPFGYGTASGSFDEERGLSLLRRLGLTRTQCDQEAGSLSQGEQQRVCLVRALLCEPDVLLLDEPTSALDEQSTAAVEELVREEAGRRGLAALIVTHSRAQAERWCDRILDLELHVGQRRPAAAPAPSSGAPPSTAPGDPA
jgi:putative ABC transport system ATP-binding protein